MGWTGAAVGEGLGGNQDFMSNSGCIVTVPAKALAVRNYNSPVAADGKGEPEMIAPQAGDPVDFSVKGSVASIDGDTATVHVAFVNGERVNAAKPADSEQETGDGE